jgi:hypothetical protein
MVLIFIVGWALECFGDGRAFLSLYSSTFGLCRHSFLLPLVISEYRWSLLIIFHNKKSVPDKHTISIHLIEEKREKNS